jgi:5'-nucleotidase
VYNGKPKILVTNDDGINSPGLESLVIALKDIGDVVVVAPDRQQSAVSSALTIHKPIKVHKQYKNNEFYGWSVEGTPTDCVKLALFTLLDYKPDLVVSGINHGRNTSINVLYSGTVSGAIEGLLMGINSMAVSHISHNTTKDMQVCSEISVKLAVELLKINDGTGILLNVNVPDLIDSEIKGIKIAHLSNSQWVDKFDKRQDPQGNDYYWFTGDYIINDTDPNADDLALKAGYITVTPIKINFTDRQKMTELKYLENLM